MSISSQIVSLFFEGLKNNTLEVSQLELIFKDFPQLIDYISENYVVFSLDKDIRKIENSSLTKIEYTFSNKEVFDYKGNKEILDLAMIIKSFADGLKKD